MSDYRGAVLPLALKTSLRQTRDGSVVERPYKVHTGYLDAFIATLRANGYTEIAAEPKEGTPFHVVTVAETQATSPSAVLADTWNLAYNEIQRTLWLKPEVKALFAGATRDQWALFKADLESYISGNRTYTDENGVEQPLTLTGLKAIAESWGADGADIDDLFDSFCEGSDSHVVSLPVIRRRTVLPSNTTFEPALNNVGSIYRTSSLLAAETTIPTNLSNSISAHFSGGYWLRKAPTMDQQEDGRWLYTEEYWYVEKETPNPVIYPTII
jgi:hypothetical protein